MKKMCVFENYRTFGEIEGNLTDRKCDVCGKAAEVYIYYDDDGPLICKGCLDDSIKKIDETFDRLQS